MLLTPWEAAAIEARVAKLEAERGLEVVTLVARKSDDYPEAVWKAFAFGAALAGLIVASAELASASWTGAAQVLGSVLAVLGAGAACALAAIFVPAVTRLVLRESRMALETQQYAKAQFLDRELFATRERTAVLLLVSLLERRVVIHADAALRALVPAQEWDGVIARMAAPLRAGRRGEAVLAGLDAIDELLGRKGLSRGSGAGFGNRPIEADR
jgi:putative membrane protein